MTSYQDVVNSNLPQAAWALVEGAGNDHAPYTGTIHLTSSGTRLYQQPGPFANSVSMHFGGDGGLVGTNSLIYTPPVTLESWFRFNPASVAANRILMYYGNTNSNGFGMFVPGGSSELCTLHGGVAVGHLGVNWPDSNWHLLQMFHGDTSTDYVYVDGRKVGQASIAANAAPTNPLAFMMNNANAEWVTGDIAMPALYPIALDAMNEYAVYLAANDPAAAIGLTLTQGGGAGIGTNALLQQILNAVTYVAH